MKNNHLSNDKSLSIIFHRDGVFRSTTYHFGAVPMPHILLEDMELDEGLIGADSWSWLFNWLQENQGSKFTSVPCMHTIHRGDWTLNFLCDIQ
jgi:hypothetical protein